MNGPTASAAFSFPGSTGWRPSRRTRRVPGSPHFFGDQLRRRDILTSMRDGERPDYSRGFSSRPQLRGSSELAGTEYDDGWGAHCYVQHADAADNDHEFSSRGPAPRGSPVRSMSEGLPHGDVLRRQSLMRFFGSIGSLPPFPWPHGSRRAKRAPHHEDLRPHPEEHRKAMRLEG